MPRTKNDAQSEDLTRGVAHAENAFKAGESYDNLLSAILGSILAIGAQMRGATPLWPVRFAFLQWMVIFAGAGLCCDLFCRLVNQNAHTRAARRHNASDQVQENQHFATTERLSSIVSKLNNIKFALSGFAIIFLVLVLCTRAN